MPAYVAQLWDVASSRSAANCQCLTVWACRPSWEGSMRNVLVGLGFALAAAEAAHAPFDDTIVPGLVYAVVVAAVSYWVWKGVGNTSVIVLGLLGLVECVLVVFVYRTNSQPPHAWVLWMFGLLTGAVTLAASLTVGYRLRGRVRPRAEMVRPG